MGGVKVFPHLMMRTMVDGHLVINRMMVIMFVVVPDDIPSHDDLGDVEDHPGDVTAEENEDYADYDRGQVDFFFHRLSLTAVGVPGEKFKVFNYTNCEREIKNISLSRKKKVFFN